MDSLIRFVLNRPSSNMFLTTLWHHHPTEWNAILRQIHNLTWVDFSVTALFAEAERKQKNRNLIWHKFIKTGFEPNVSSVRADRLVHLGCLGRLWYVNHCLSVTCDISVPVIYHQQHHNKPYGQTLLKLNWKYSGTVCYEVYYTNILLYSNLFKLNIQTNFKFTIILQSRLLTLHTNLPCFNISVGQLETWHRL